MAENDFEKTEAPTPRRRQEAREDGNVARSQDLTAALTLLASILLLYVFGMQVLSGMKLTVLKVLSDEHVENPTRSGDVMSLMSLSGRLLVDSVAPVMLCLMAIALVGSLGQVGFMLTGKPLVPKFSRINPLSGAKNLVDARAGVRLLMSLGKVAIIAGVAAWVILQDLTLIATLPQLEILPMFSESCRLVFMLGLKLAVLLILLAILDYAFQVWKREQDLKMSKHEVKEEMRRMEGDPMVKQRRARVARQLALQRINQSVPKADVVVTNPTHFAVALQYDSGRMNAPKVIAKGADYLAARIRQLAAQHEVPIIERKELARGLYWNVEIGQEVPPEYYTAVAEILAYVYRVSGRQARRSA